MDESVAASESATGPQPPLPTESAAVRALRLASFRVTYVAILVFVLLSLTSIDQARKLLDLHFRRAIDRAVQVSPAYGPIVPQIENRVEELLRRSPWTRWGDVEVDVQVFSADGRTTLYAIG